MSTIRPSLAKGATREEINAYFRTYRRKNRARLRAYHRTYMRRFRKERRREALKTGAS